MVENLLPMSTGLPLLSLLILLLPAGAGLIWLFPDARMARWVALLTEIVGLLISMTVVAGFDAATAGFLHHRTGSTEIISLGGAATKMPLLAAFFFLFGIAAMGVPGTSGFPAEFLMIISALKTHAGAGLAALFGVILGAVYFLGIFRKAFLGPVTNSVIDECVDLRWRELLTVSVFALLILIRGCFRRRSWM